MMELYQRENVYHESRFLVQQRHEHEAEPAVSRSITTSMKKHVLTTSYTN